ncbi:SDR family NAD(P)-dependent oxidoreductase [Shewanella surugensis]|uniref:SDR family NAD(P)-dependent oxidoreductase n=1 Tax=Shewanella surugensis TaxID=212020 RepID=UPI00289D3F20|nr:SDR family NAD(P)-dependent oxidoreductase [Shewanella surugensis]
MMSNTVALVVGGSSGMGKEVAERLLIQGYSVIILANDPIKLAQAKLALELKTAGDVETKVVDLYDKQAVIIWWLD